MSSLSGWFLTLASIVVIFALSLGNAWLLDALIKKGSTLSFFVSMVLAIMEFSVSMCVLHKLFGGKDKKEGQGDDNEHGQK
jgi:hypothetical protein